MYKPMSIGWFDCKANIAELLDYFREKYSVRSSFICAVLKSKITKRKNMEYHLPFDSGKT